MIISRDSCYDVQEDMNPVMLFSGLNAFGVVLSQAVWDGILIAHQPDGNDYVSEGVQHIVSAVMDVLDSGR